MKYVPRLMSATDAFFYHGLYGQAVAQERVKTKKRAPKDIISFSEVEKRELDVNRYPEVMYESVMRAADEVLAARGVENEPTPEEIEAVINGLMDVGGNGVKLSNKAIKALVGDVVTPAVFKKRVYELMDNFLSSVDPVIEEVAARHAARGTYTYEPEGVLGAMARGMNYFSSQLPPLRFIVPFTNIVSNIANQSLDYTPYGLVRAGGVGIMDMTNKLFGTSGASSAAQNAEESYNMLMKAVTGSVLLSMAYILFAGAGDDETEEPAITANGPKDYVKKLQLMSKGWVPNSIRVGDKYIPYKDFPQLAFPLAVLGNIVDYHRYNKPATEEMVEGMEMSTAEYNKMIKTFTNAEAFTTQSLYVGMSHAPSIFLDMSFLSGLADMVVTFADGDDKKITRWASTASSRIIGGAVPFSGTIKSIDEAFDPSIYNATTFNEKVMNQLPFVRRYNQPKLNVWGEPVRRETSGLAHIVGVSRFVSNQRDSNPASELYSKYGVFLPSIGNATIIRGEKIGDNPDLAYEYRMLVSKLHTKNVSQRYNELDTLTRVAFLRQTQGMFSEAKGVVKGLMNEGKTTEEIMAELGLAE